MIWSAIAVSDDIDMEDALQEVTNDCRDQLHGRRANVGILYTSCMDADLASMLHFVKREFPDTELIGCTTDGEITPQKAFSEDSVALLLLGSENIPFATSVARDISQKPEEAIRDAYNHARKRLGTEPVCAIVLPDGLTSIGLPLDMLLRNVMGDRFPVFGGIAGDHFLLEKTYQFHGTEVLTDSMPMLLVGGELELAASVFTGPVPYGPTYRIEDYQDNVIRRIANKTVIDFYREEYGGSTEMYTNFPLAVYPEDGDHYFLRNPILIDEDEGSIAFVGNFPPRCSIRLTQVLREDILRSAVDANKKLLDDLDGRPPDLILIFSCTARRHVLGSETSKEVDIFRNARHAIPFFGFYCYGEIAPFSVGLPPRFHNETFVSIALLSKT